MPVNFVFASLWEGAYKCTVQSTRTVEAVVAEVPVLSDFFGKFADTTCSVIIQPTNIQHLNHCHLPPSASTKQPTRQGQTTYIASYLNIMVFKPLKKLLKPKKPKGADRPQGPMNRIVGTASTGSTASMLEQIQAKMLEEEDTAWNMMELDLAIPEDGQERVGSGNEIKH